MNVWPLRFRPMQNGVLFADDAGGWFTSDEAFLERYATDHLTDADREFLASQGHAFAKEGDLAHTGFAWRWAARQAIAHDLAYIILVPTLRCNLSCGYCQVSRAAENAKGYDWSETTVDQVIAFLDRLSARQVQIEFQGGEPLLRLDLLERIRAFCRNRFDTSQFIVCTNLQRLGEAEWAFLSAADTYTSTSLDGDYQTHDRQRTGSHRLADTFFENLTMAAQRLGPDHLSALPTIDVTDPPDFAKLVDQYEALGIRSIYLRPINHQGFARRRGNLDDELARWTRLHSGFVDHLIDRYHRTGRLVEEYYFTHCLRRVLSAGQEGHVDIRNPNLFAADYLVVDHDGKLYPSDEARMVSRIGRMDLSIGHVASGIDQDKTAAMNAMSLNTFDPDCIHCPYQPFCGTDVVDDISRYGRIDVPRHGTWFCGRHMAVFDKIFDLICRRDSATDAVLAQWAGIGAWPTSLRLVHA